MGSYSFCSTCSVAILPEPADDSDVSIPESELKFDYMRSSGPGGQNVNTCDTACRVTHLPTGLFFKAQASTYLLSTSNLRYENSLQSISNRNESFKTYFEVLLIKDFLF